MGGGGPREGAHGGSLHPQPDLVDGSPLMSGGIQGEGALQCLPPTIGVCEEHGIGEPLPGPSMIWGHRWKSLGN